MATCPHPQSCRNPFYCYQRLRPQPHCQRRIARISLGSSNQIHFSPNPIPSLVLSDKLHPLLSCFTFLPWHNRQTVSDVAGLICNGSSACTMTRPLRIELTDVKARCRKKPKRVITKNILNSAIVAIVGWVTFEIQIQTATCDQHLSADSKLAASSFTPVRVVSIGPDPVYRDMLGLRTNGWLGSDVDESIVISAGKTLWLFGDTFIGALTNGVRVGGAPMINSTIAIQDRTRPPPDCLTFYWKEKDGQPASFFPHHAGTPGDYYWVTKGVMLDGQLFLWAWCIANQGAQPGGFREMGSALIRIRNPLDPLDRWVQQVSTLELPTGTTFQTALVLKPPYLYLYGVVPLRQSALARVRVNDLLAGKLTEAYEYWVRGPGGPHWGRQPTNCVPQFLPVNTECTVNYEPTCGLYLCFTYSPAGPDIFLTSAKELTGPWTRPKSIYQIPEHRQFSFPIISYAVRQHPELATRPGEIILTYVTNVPDSVGKLFTKSGSELYVPRFLRLQLSPE